MIILLTHECIMDNIIKEAIYCAAIELTYLVDNKKISILFLTLIETTWGPKLNKYTLSQ